MSKHIEALKLALEALETLMLERGSIYDKAIIALREALAEQDCTRSHPHEEMSKECELRTEIARLTNCLSRVNAQAEHFEREWYLRGDEIERLKAQPDPYKQGYADAMNWKVQNHLEHLPTAQPEQEPVAWLSKGGKGIWFHEPDASLNATPLYTAQPQRTKG